MKAIRTFQLDPDDKLLRMDSIVLPIEEDSEDSLEFPQKLSITASVSPDSVAPQAFFLSCDSDVSLDVRIREMQHFINVLKFMYYGS